MDDALMPEITLFAGNYSPANWEFCHGQVLPINTNKARPLGHDPVG